MQQHLPEDVPQNFMTSPSPDLSDKFHGEDMTTILMKCRTIFLTFTPLALPASIHLEDNLKSIVRFFILPSTFYKSDALCSES